MTGNPTSSSRWQRHSLKGWQTLLLVGIALLTGPAQAERRVALVIGNSAYAESPLANPINDARDVRAKLQTMGFAAADIVYRENLKTAEIGEVQREFRERLGAGGDTVALVFYAGHGVQSAGENYFPAVDARLRSEEDLPQYSLRLVKLMELLEQAKTRLNLVFLDACRNNPLARKTRSGARGLARVEAPSGTLITFATQPNAVADDGNGRNGVFTQNLLAHIDTPGMELEAMLKRVVRGVRQDTQERQSPWKEGGHRPGLLLCAGRRRGSATSRQAEAGSSGARAVWQRAHGPYVGGRQEEAAGSRWQPPDIPGHEPRVRHCRSGRAAGRSADQGSPAAQSLEPAGSGGAAHWL
jgi:uncharacterized caspase-like protein